MLVIRYSFKVRMRKVGMDPLKSLLTKEMRFGLMVNLKDLMFAEYNLLVMKRKKKISSK